MPGSRVCDLSFGVRRMHGAICFGHWDIVGSTSMHGGNHGIHVHRGAEGAAKKKRPFGVIFDRFWGHFWPILKSGNP